MRNKHTGQKAVEWFLASEFPGWRIAAERDKGGNGVLFRLFDQKGAPRHILGVTDELLVNYATAEDLRGFLSRLGVREKLGERGSEAVWLLPTGWQ
jgi:hypothetical protein